MFLLGGRNVIADPLQIGRYNDKHSYNCEEYPDEFLEHKEQLTKVKSLINPDTQIKQEWEKNREYKEKNPNSNIVLVEFSCEKNFERKNYNFLNIKFYFYAKPNRIYLSK